MVQDQQLIRNFTTPWKLRLWMARHLPMGMLSGLYIRELDQARVRSGAQRQVVDQKPLWISLLGRHGHGG
jgi:hypothetical protein